MKVTHANIIMAYLYAFVNVTFYSIRMFYEEPDKDDYEY